MAIEYKVAKTISDLDKVLEVRYKVFAEEFDSIHIIRFLCF